MLDVLLSFALTYLVLVIETAVLAVLVWSWYEARPLMRASWLHDVRVRMIILLDFFSDSCASHEAFIVRVLVVRSHLGNAVSLKALAADDLSSL